jgi:proline iminopeptidase
MHVDAGLQMETASRIGNTHTWVTNEYEHDGIRSDRVYAHLTELLEGLWI